MLEQTLIRPADVDSVKTEDFEMRFVHFGNKLGKPVVILPGLSVKSVMDSYQAIEKQYTIFADSCDVYLFDRREEVTKGYDMNMMAEDTIKVMDLLNLQEAYLMGVSQGGMLAQMITVKRPDLVGKLILCSTTAYETEEADEKIKEWITLAEEGNKEELVMAFADNVYSPSAVEANREFFKAMAETITEEELEKFIILAKAAEGFDLRDKLTEVKCPSLVIGAGQDQIFGKEASEELAELLRGNLYIYENGSHGAYDEEPDYPERLYNYFIHGVYEDWYWK